ncbi:hypothetical protein IQ247_22240 [Plectonema cf. radiosum LEGE 06105]|uniref:Uncharacterized protein n=1 Tax=Plectonema cf. radiosum LEGE 06105 TaxID=945769 RepID=A0A8J7FCD3_9CYAN|nr:hypothetical protein [Plectonema radiosum]MBE9215349.1 hypothetical protein [Plectonema cf. radiosum LEGE 06105]
MPKQDSTKLTKVSVNLPFGIGGTEWEPDDTERKAAWSLLVELVTRVTIQPLETDQGLLREALTSLYSLFATTREILKQAGPNVGASRQSVGGIAIIVLNRGLRPFLAKWHPLLQSWEVQRPPNVSPQEHEKNWSYHDQLRNELELLRGDLQEYAIGLSVIAGVDYCF